MEDNQDFQDRLNKLESDLEHFDEPEEKVVPLSQREDVDDGQQEKLTEKQKLAMDCWELYCRIVDTGYEFPKEKRQTEYKLSRTSVTKLKALLAELLTLGGEVEMKAQILAKDSGTVPHPVTTPASKLQQVTESRVNNAEIVAEQLFHFNLIITQFVELAGSHPKIRDKTKINLEGLTESVAEDRDSLLPILERIYLENADKLEGLLSPVNQYLFFMGRHISSTAASNHFGYVDDESETIDEDDQVEYPD